MTNNLMVEFCGAFGAQQPILKILCERNNSDDSSSFGQGEAVQVDLRFTLC